jgi:exopolysaccharide production protein ExoQ
MTNLRQARVLVGAMLLAAFSSAPFVALSIDVLNEPPEVSTWPFVYSYWLAALVGVALLGTSALIEFRENRLLKLASLPVAALAGWMLLSGLWSVAPSTTPVQALLVTGVLAAALGFGVVLDVREQIAAVVLVTQALILLSLLYVAFRPERGIGLGGWQGVFGSKSTLGPIAALAAISALAIGPMIRSAIWVRSVLALLIILDTVVLVGSRSATAVVALLAALTAVVARRITSTGSGKRNRFVILGMVGAPVAVALGVGTVMGKGWDFSSRTSVWSAVLRKVQERPLLGFGYRSLWDDKSFLDPIYIESGLVFDNAHNSVVEALLGMGYVGAVLVTAVICVPIWAVWTQADLRHLSNTDAYLIAVVVFCAVMNLMEAMIVYHSIFWVLLVSGGATRCASGQQHSQVAEDR